MDVVHPAHFFRLFGSGDVEVHHHRLLAAAAEHAGQRLGVGGVDLLVGNVRRDVDEVAGACFGDEFEPLAPAHARRSAHYVNHAFHRTVVMRPGLGPGMDHYRPGPELFRPGARVGDRRGAVHARRLRRIAVKFRAPDDPHTVELPLRSDLAAHDSPDYARFSVTSTSTVGMIVLSSESAYRPRGPLSREVACRNAATPDTPTMMPPAAYSTENSWKPV